MKNNNFIKEIFLLILVALFSSANIFAFGAIGTTQNSAGPIDFRSNSSNYQFDAEVGAPAVGQSVSTNYIFDHGAFWDDTANSTVAKIHWLVQELRNYSSGQNDSMIFFLKFKQGGSVVYTTPLFTSLSDGTYDTGIDLSSVPPGTYDVYVKGFQTLTKKYSNVQISSGENILNFTQNNVSSTTKGSVSLLAGDVTETGSNNQNLGNDFINASDIGVILGTFGNTGSFVRSDIDQNSLVNASDIGIVLKNFGLSGDN